MPILSYEELEHELDATRERLDKAVEALNGTLSAEQFKRAFDIGFQEGMDTVISGKIRIAADSK